MYQLAALVLLSLTTAELYTIQLRSRTGSLQNNISLSCVDLLDEVLDGAIYLRNGAVEDGCLRESSMVIDNGGISIVLNASCEGFYQCGRVASNENYILSKPVPLYGKL